MKSVYAISLAVTVIAGAGCANKGTSVQSEIRSTPQLPRNSAKERTTERFSVKVVTEENAQINRDGTESEGAYYAKDVFYKKIPSGLQTIETHFVVGNYSIGISPAARIPIRITLEGVSGSLTWTILDTTIADVSAAGREALLNFKTPIETVFNAHKTSILVRSGDTIVFRFGIKIGGTTEKLRALIVRLDENDLIMDMYGESVPFVIEKPSLEELRRDPPQSRLNQLLAVDFYRYP